MGRSIYEAVCSINHFLVNSHPGYGASIAKSAGISVWQSLCKLIKPYKLLYI